MPFLLFRVRPPARRSILCSSVLRRYIKDKPIYLEADPAAPGVGAEGVDDLQLARDHVVPLGPPREGLCLLVPLENLGLVIEGVVRVEFVAGVGPDVRDRHRRRDAIAVSLQKEIAGRGQVTNVCALLCPQ